MASLNALLRFRGALVSLKRAYYNHIWGMDIDPTATFSLSAHFDLTYPKGVHIGPETYVAFGAVILAHDMTRGAYRDTRIGRRCFIGARSFILPGVQIGDECIVGAGSVVTKDVPSRSIAAGNPARVIRSNIVVGRYGRLLAPSSAKQNNADSSAG
jgi:acetyltransferase-like isoleucine patch superfamily enzyme